MSSRERQNFRKKDGQRDNNKDKNEVEADVNNPVIKQFQIYSSELTEKHDRHERLVKASRDITIESKRIIFLLHNIDARKNNKDSIFQEAIQRIEKLCSKNFGVIAKELQGLEVYQHLKAISAGLQEFIEANSFLEFLQNKEISDWNDLEQRLIYKTEGDEQQEYSLKVVPAEFILGLADLTGEVMRNCINSLNCCDTERCLEGCKFLQNIYARYLTLCNFPNRSRDYSQKMSTMKQSVMKAENVCYNLKVRGTEGSKLISFDSNLETVDEGFY